MTFGDLLTAITMAATYISSPIFVQIFDGSIACFRMATSRVPEFGPTYYNPSFGYRTLANTVSGIYSIPQDLAIYSIDTVHEASAAFVRTWSCQYLPNQRQFHFLLIFHLEMADSGPPTAVLQQSGSHVAPTVERHMPDMFSAIGQPSLAVPILPKDRKSKAIFLACTDPKTRLDMAVHEQAFFQTQLNNGSRETLLNMVTNHAAFAKALNGLGFDNAGISSVQLQNAVIVTREDVFDYFRWSPATFKKKSRIFDWAKDSVETKKWDKVRYPKRDGMLFALAS